MRRTMYDRINSGETTYKDAIRFRFIQAGLVLFGLISLVLLVVK